MFGNKLLSISVYLWPVLSFSSTQVLAKAPLAVRNKLAITYVFYLHGRETLMDCSAFGNDVPVVLVRVKGLCEKKWLSWDVSGDDY